jgi:hypothetical protein
MMMQYVPFIVLEGTWMMMTGFALLRRYVQWREQYVGTLAQSGSLVAS